MSKEIIDLEEDRTFTTAKSVKEKDLMIDELNKKIRFIKFEHEKNIKSLEAEVNELKEKLHISEQNSKINTYEQIVEELEKNLTITENELLKFKEIEMELKKQIYNLKSENSSIKNENEKLLKYKDLNKEVEELRLLKQNFEELQANIKETAIEAIMEKENELNNYRERFSEQEAVNNVKIDSLNNEINKLQEKLFKSGVFLRDSAEISFEPSEIDKLREENEKLRRDFEIERVELNERVEILTVELEKEISNSELNKVNLEREINERAYQKLKEQMEASSKSEYNLIEELQKYDEQIKTYEIQTKDYEKRLNSQEEKHLKAIDFYKKKIEELEKNLEMKNFEKKNEKKLEVQISQMKEEYETKIHENSNVIKSLEKLKEKDMQRILQLEGENKKLNQNIEKLKQSILSLENSKIEIEEKMKTTLNEYEERIAELSAVRERAKSEAKNKRNPKPSFFSKVSDDNLTLGNDLIKGLDEFARPSINISPNSAVILSNELKDFTCEENWVHNDIKDMLVDLNTSKAAQYNKKQFSFPAIKIVDFDKTPIQTQPQIQFQPSPRGSQEKILKLEDELIELQKENSNLKLELQELNKILLQEIEKNKTKEAELTKNNQNQRRQTLEGLKLFPAGFLENIQIQNQGQGLENIEKAFLQLENLTQEKKEMENKYFKLKREYEEEKKFLEEELKHTEEAAIEAKLQFAIIATEKDYFEHEHKIIIHELKKKKINIDYDEKRKEGSILRILLCNCKG